MVLKSGKVRISWPHLVRSLFGGTFWRVPGQHKVSYGKTDNSSLGLFLFLEKPQSHWIRAPPLWPHLILITSQRFISFRSSFHLSQWGLYFKCVLVGMFTPQQRTDIGNGEQKREASYYCCQMEADLGCVASSTFTAGFPAPRCSFPH